MARGEVRIRGLIGTGVTRVAGHATGRARGSLEARGGGVIRDPERRGHALADFCLTVGPSLFTDLEHAGVLPGDPAALARARVEWECFALYACVRGLVAAGGFNRETGAAIEALHHRVLAAWSAAAPGPAGSEERRAQVSERYAEYGGIGQQGGASAAATVTRRLGEAAARHMVGGEPSAALAELAGALHESLAEGAAEAVRRGE